MVGGYLKKGPSSNTYNCNLVSTLYMYMGKSQLLISSIQLKHKHVSYMQGICIYYFIENYYHQLLYSSA